MAEKELILDIKLLIKTVEEQMLIKTVEEFEKENTYE